ncbi:hypothetical protein ACFX19_043913 [Malus domestica]
MGSGYYKRKRFMNSPSTVWIVCLDLLIFYFLKCIPYMSLNIYYMSFAFYVVMRSYSSPINKKAIHS